MKVLTVLISLVLILTSCSSEEEKYTPKKFGQLRIKKDLVPSTYKSPELIAHSYLALPENASVNIKQQNDTVSNFEIKIDRYKATLYMTHISLQNDLRERMELSHDITKQHLVKADDFYDTLILKPENKVYGQVFNLTGNVASNLQFIVTDSTDNLLRGALYFYASPNYDSLRPYLNILEQDVYHLLDNLKWEN